MLRSGWVYAGKVKAPDCGGLQVLLNDHETASQVRQHPGDPLALLRAHMTDGTPQAPLCRQ